MNLPAPALRGVLTTLAAAGLIASLASAGAAVGSPQGKPTRGAEIAVPSGPPKADRDGDKLFDDLEARLAGAPDDRRQDVLVALAAPASSERLADLERRVGAFTTSRRFTVVDAFAATVTKGQATALARVPWVRHVEANAPVRAFNDGAAGSFGVAKARADAPGLDGDSDGDGATYSAGDLVAAVIDTGIDAAHADLDDGKVLAFKDFVNGRSEPYDDNGHGTHVAATIAGDGEARADRAYRGVAPGAGLVGLKVLAADGSGDMGAVTAAIDWAVQNRAAYGIEAINLSLGESGCGAGSDVASAAVNAAHAAGLVVAVAAGNEGPGTCTIGSPAAARDALTVGAMSDTASGGFGQAWFSSRGPTADGRIKPDVSAPGVEILSAQSGTSTGYSSLSGTSMATPFTAGVALLMLDANPALTPGQVKSTLTGTAQDWARGGNNRTAGTTGPDIDYGAGRVDAYAALKAAGAPLASGPNVPVHNLYQGTLGATGARVDHKLTVTDTGFPIAATLILPSVTGAAAYSPDFDLYLYDPAGALVARAETVSRQEDVSFRPATTGTYTLRVASYYGSGPYVLDVSSGVAVDSTPPTVSSVSPASGAAGVAAGTNVTAGFSEPMEAASAERALTVVRASDGAPVAGAYRWTGTTLTFDPTTDLAPGTTYRARVSAEARDAAGNALAAESVWTFTTAAAPAATTMLPSATVIQSGSFRSGDATRLHANDDLFYAVNSTTSSTYTSSWYGRLTGVSNALTGLRIVYRGRNSRTCAQTVAVQRWTDNAWVQIDSRSVGTTESEVAVTLGGTLANYVSGTTGDGEVRVRVRCTTSYGSFYASGDLLAATVTR